MKKMTHLAQSSWSLEFDSLVNVVSFSSVGALPAQLWVTNENTSANTINIPLNIWTCHVIYTLQDICLNMRKITTFYYLRSEPLCSLKEWVEINLLSSLHKYFQRPFLTFYCLTALPDSGVLLMVGCEIIFSWSWFISRLVLLIIFIRLKNKFGHNYNLLYIAKYLDNTIKGILTLIIKSEHEKGLWNFFNRFKFNRFARVLSVFSVWLKLLKEMKSIF